MDHRIRCLEHRSWTGDRPAASLALAYNGAPQWIANRQSLQSSRHLIAPCWIDSPQRDRACGQCIRLPQHWFWFLCDCYISLIREVGPKFPCRRLAVSVHDLSKSMKQTKVNIPILIILSSLYIYPYIWSFSSSLYLNPYTLIMFHIPIHGCRFQ